MSRPSSPLAAQLADQLRAARIELAGRWLDRISDRVALDPQRVFPTDELLDHMPLLVVGIANFIEDPSGVIPGDSSVVFHARELGALRHTQGFSEYQILKEFEILGGILFSFMIRSVEAIDEPCAPAELLGCAQRIFLAISLIQQATTSRFLELAKARVVEREERLRAFHRALTHEMRNRIGATLGAGQLLQMVDIPADRKEELASLVVRNADSMRVVLENLLELSRLHPQARQERHIHLAAAAGEVVRQMRDMAAAHQVQLRLASDLPAVDVNAAAVELCLTNLVSNGIKYASSTGEQRWVEIGGRVINGVGGDPAEVVIEVRDNGIGIPDSARARLFQRFFRAHESSLPAIDGTGLGLSLVRETVEALGGRIETQHPGTGTIFQIWLPCRRSSDASSIRGEVVAEAGQG